ncbi:hypothetical protein RIF29_33240 [Crotalaria pallida]|uniref:Uncharacterized protein n=1 Tax=Crotalaria pallida TaxID=3830 RepID=A0AAN9E7L2_CROPI
MACHLLLHSGYLADMKTWICNGDSASEGTSEGSDENSHSDTQLRSGERHDSFEAVPGPTTNLNIVMDYWGAPTSSATPALHGKAECAEALKEENASLCSEVS